MKELRVPLTPVLQMGNNEVVEKNFTFKIVYLSLSRGRSIGVCTYSLVFCPFLSSCQYIDYIIYPLKVSHFSCMGQEGTQTYNSVGTGSGKKPRCPII